MLEGGNARARAAYLANLPRGYAEPTPDTEDERRATFIRAKYVRLKWASTELREARKGQMGNSRRAVAAARASSTKGRGAGRGGPAGSRPMPSLSSEAM